MPRVVYSVGVALTALVFLLGAWERRWIADDGLIVLRTVRNLLAGNGPVFNIDERVETNTSAAWTYIVFAFSWLTQARLEYVVLGLTLTLSVVAIVLAMLGAGRLWGGTKAGLLVPAGALVYVAVPPARDYASSGLESALVICWLALLWLLLVRWSKSESVKLPGLLVIGFVAGMGPMVRPEMLMVAAPALLMVFLSPMARPWLTRILFVVIAGAVPVGYQIWRMGYYGLPYPNTAVSKDAAGAKWNQGFSYLWNLVDPYFLWVPVVVLAIAGVLLAVWNRTPARAAAAQPAARRSNKHSAPDSGQRQARVLRLRAWLRTPSAVVTLFLGCALLLQVYSLRVGGDFMHGRMLLPVLFCLILPVAVLPIRLPARSSVAARGRGRSYAPALVGLAAFLAVIGWAYIASNTTGMTTGTTIGRSGIVDERAYYVLNTGHDHPIRAEDYLDYPRMRAMVDAIERTPDGGLLINTPSYMYWDVVPPPLPIPEGGAGHTVYFLNLGMTSMNVPLDVRVIDPMGLAYPLAAHSDRLMDGRIGHDKSLFADWVVADTGMVDQHPWLPYYFDEDWVQQAEVALTCPETQDMLDSSRGDLTWERFKNNVKRSFEYAEYRFDRVPEYAIELCGLEDPIPENAR
nr:flagellar motor control protein ZomB [Aldersonia kunmingensis]